MGYRCLLKSLNWFSCSRSSIRIHILYEKNSDFSYPKAVPEIPNGSEILVAWWYSLDGYLICTRDYMLPLLCRLNFVCKFYMSILGHVKCFTYHDHKQENDDKRIIVVLSWKKFLLGSLLVSDAVPPNTQLVGAGFFW